MHVSLCGVDVVTFNAIERYVSCRETRCMCDGGNYKDGTMVDDCGWMCVGSRVYCMCV